MKTSRAARLEKITRRALADNQEFTGKGGWSDVRRLWKDYVVSHRRTLIGIFLMMLVWASVPYFFAMTHMVLIDNVLAPGAAGITFLKSYRGSVLAGLVFVFVGNMLLHTVNLIGHLVTSRYTLRIGQNVSIKLRGQIYSKLDDLQLSYFDRTQTGRIIARIQNDVSQLQNMLTHHLGPLMIEPIKLVVGFIVLFSMNWRLAMILAIAAPFYGLLFLLVRPMIRRNAMAQSRLTSRLYGLSSERLAAHPVIKAFGTERAELGRFTGMVSDGARLNLRNAYYNQGLGFMAGAISTSASALILWFGLRSVELGLHDMTLGAVVAFVQLTGQVFLPIQSLTSMGAVLQSSLVSLRRVLSLLDSPLGQKHGTLKLTGMQGKVRLDEVSFRYEGQSQAALDHVSFQVQPGEHVALMGPSGAGKSSLFNLLLRLYTPTEGDIYIGGVNLDDADTASLRRHVRYVQQVPFMFSGTIAQNISYGARDASLEQIAAAAKSVEMHEFIMALPEGYNTLVGENGVGLSGGQRQRLALATALLTKPEIMLLDDPTSALDAETEARIWETLQQVLNGRTSLIITQRISMARRCDRVIVLEKGKMTQIGTHLDLAAQPGFYQRICIEQDAMPQQ